MEKNLVLLTLEYSYLVNSSNTTYFQTNNGLWNHYQVGENIISSNVQNNLRVIDNLGSIENEVKKISQTSQNYISTIKPQVNNQLITVSINGTKDFINDSRIRILQSYNQINYKQIKLSTNEFRKLDNDPCKLLVMLNKLSLRYNVEILIDNIDTEFKNVDKKSTNYYIYILGNQDNITITESQVRILIDNMLNGFHIDSVDIDLSLIPIIGGIELFNFSQIAKQSDSNIYIPDLLPELFNSKILNTTKNLKIWITSKEIYQILITKDILNNLINRILEEQNTLVIKEIDLTKVKIDLITLFNQSNILGIMFKYGTFIQVPSLGEADKYKIKVQGQSVESINESIHELTLLSSDYYTININFRNCFNKELEYYLINLMHLKKTCIITYNQYGIEINGSSKEIKQILSKLNANYYFWRSILNHFTINLRIEINNDQKDFISGKKNGKIIKILNQLNNLAIIKFNPFNEYNFFIDLKLISDNDLVISNLMTGIELIELELPAELKFNIPEVFHKSIIGNGGSIIQSIMKKYNVFIKFSSNFNSTQDKIFYSFKRCNNVLIKCPKKNSKNISLVKQEIDQLVMHCCLNNKPVTNGGTIYNTTNFELRKSHYVLMVNQNYNLKFINNLEIETNTYINFPDSIEEFGNADRLIIPIKGSDTKSILCAQKLCQFLPQNYQFRITYCPGRFDNEISRSNKEFHDRIIIPFKVLLKIEVSVKTTENSHHEIMLSYFAPSDISVAINNLTLYLREKNFLILDKSYLQLNPIIEVSNPVANKLKPITNYATSGKSKKYLQNQNQNSAIALPRIDYDTPLSSINNYVHYIG
ncbi:DEHA2D11880p [Debaryomyces hansenii CBS767]|uniref:DEHA2D11880p n=1 Tax=Debaryomyces hansenii (strain ATCC 36239 / CBS 767 / BCRC 21394 / JCM 1990 / NBRC 0083 / IGC 2968) TaxID=284592 RepID=B5RTH2_DEBHA|nr:DEHA2D11880p [Debaryomyces hansenii CBS767]CAR65657.1 DEHA2D11880p [Debaryomyces hansenii CBS767]|eukprot:XP_002770302.1 DEHA2D11880p [Debaryomyces hansenii CBS767]